MVHKDFPEAMNFPNYGRDRRITARSGTMARFGIRGNKAAAHAAWP
jgi:hypothetical protein